MKPSERIKELWLSKQRDYEACSEYYMTGDMRMWFFFDALTQYLDEQSEQKKENNG